jgi:hypothetical protein
MLKAKRQLVAIMLVHHIPVQTGMRWILHFLNEIILVKDA